MIIESLMLSGINYYYSLYDGESSQRVKHHYLLEHYTRLHERYDHASVAYDFNKLKWILRKDLILLY